MIFAAIQVKDGHFILQVKAGLKLYDKQ